MKTYILYVDGVKSGMLRAKDHNAAERKAWAKYPSYDRFRITVAYTEI